MMRHLRSATFFHLCVVSCASAICFPELHAQDTATSAPPIVDLFDGKTLDGWEGDSAHWRIEDGTILGEIARGQSLNKNTWLVWRGGKLSDFELNVQFKLTGLPAANSGIQIRCQVDNVDHVAGYQADQSEALAPKLSGSGAKGIDYLVENVIDPNAVIGRDFQARIIVTTEGRVITGLIEKETDSSITVQKLTESVTVAKSEIEETKISSNSFMPEGLLKALNERERIELFKFLMAQ